MRAQIILATAARGKAARQDASRRRANRQHQLERGVDVITDVVDTDGRIPNTRESVTTEAIPSGRDEALAADDRTLAEPVLNKTDETLVSTATPGVVRLERDVTIDGTEVQLTAHVKEVGSGTDGGEGKSMKMLLVAVEKKARRSSRLSLEAADLGNIVSAVGGTDKRQGGGGIIGGALGAFSAVLKALTVFNSRRKDLFILSYKGKKVVAPH